MTISIFDLFSIGIGPSSSHTIGPMNACDSFITSLKQGGLLSQIHHLQIDLYGSLALTGVGHGTVQAILVGLEGEHPETIDPTTINPRADAIVANQILNFAGEHAVAFIKTRDFLFHLSEVLPYHSNAMRLTANGANGVSLFTETYYSVGGGFIVTDTELKNPAAAVTPTSTPVPYPFTKAAQLLELCNTHQLTIDKLMLANELVWHSEAEIIQKLDAIIAVMSDCVDRGLRTPGILPGGLQVKRRAPDLIRKLKEKTQTTDLCAPTTVIAMDWLNVFAIAVNEENAAGGRVVTAPTNGAAGVIPSVLTFYSRFHPGVGAEQARQFLLVAGAIALLYKHGASLSAAEVGCQGEIGVASSMAAGALTAVLGGSLKQIANAAEIAMEHHLGMTCDPINGLVQIPCIERNAMGAVKAVNACHLALSGEGEHHVSLDKVIATMKRTGLDMMSIYKETSLGGLAVNIPEC